MARKRMATWCPSCAQWSEGAERRCVACGRDLSEWTPVEVSGEPFEFEGLHQVKAALRDLRRGRTSAEEVRERLLATVEKRGALENLPYHAPRKGAK